MTLPGNSHAPIVHFTEKHRFLSNFSDLPEPLWLWGQPWPTAEHAFQAAKTLDPGQRGWVLTAPNAQTAKRRGRAVTLRPDWDTIKRNVMLQVVAAKFSQPGPAVLLMATGDAVLVEGNTWGDDYWGAVPDAETIEGQIWPVRDGTLLAGRNWLGRILMTTRELLTPEA